MCSAGVRSRVQCLRESAQAGGRSDHKTTDTMHRVNLLSLTRPPGVAEAEPGQRHTSGDAGTAQLGPCSSATELLFAPDVQGFTQELLFIASLIRRF